MNDVCKIACPALYTHRSGLCQSLTRVNSSFSVITAVSVNQLCRWRSCVWAKPSLQGGCRRGQLLCQSWWVLETTVGKEMAGPKARCRIPYVISYAEFPRLGRKKKSTFLWLLVQIISCMRFRALSAPRLKVQTPPISLLQVTVSSHGSVGDEKVYDSVLEIMGCKRKRVTDIFSPSCEVPLFSAQSTNVRPTPIWCSVSLCFPSDCTPKTLQAIRRNAVCFVLQAWFKMG